MPLAKVTLISFDTMTPVVLLASIVNVVGVLIADVGVPEI